jgi:hypothetical protein
MRENFGWVHLTPDGAKEQRNRDPNRTRPFRCARRR